MHLYSLFDVKTNTFSGPISAENNSAVIRYLVGVSLSGKGGLFSDYPEDYKVYHVADFDENTGSVTELPAILFVADLMGEIRSYIHSKDALKNQLALPLDDIDE